MDIEQVRRTYAEQLMQLPNVRGVGIGQKAGKEVILVGVTHKVPESTLQPHEVVPKTLEGYEIVVDEWGELTAQAR